MFYADDVEGREWVYILLSASPIDLAAYKKRLLTNSMGQIKRELSKDRRLARIRKSDGGELLSVDARLSTEQIMIIELILTKR